MQTAAPENHQSEVQRLSARLRTGTAAAHQHAERAPFITALLKGQVSRAAYTAFLGSLYHVYAMLENVMAQHRTHPVIAPLYHPELERTACLRDDLRCLSRARWRAADGRTPATTAYVDRLQILGDHEPELLVAHAYTRYLGDLSGGQAMKRVLQRTFDLDGEHGLAFFEFPRIPDIRRFKEDYRAALDALPVFPESVVRIIAEAQRAFGLNRALVDELWDCRAEEGDVEVIP